MGKKVYCLIGQRCKCIKFESEKDASDVEIIVHKLRDVCERDTHLSALVHDKNIVLQMKDEDRDIWCDIEEDEEVPDKSDVNVLFVAPMHDVSLSFSNNISPIFTIPKCEGKKYPDAGVEVLYTEPLNDETLHGHALQSSSCDRDRNVVMPMDTNPEDPLDNQDHDSETFQASTSTASTMISSTTGSGAVTPSTPLPPLSYDLIQKLKQHGVLAIQKDLMAHWGFYLWEVTAGSPMKRDYQNMASLIVQKYPELGSKEGGTSIVRSTLSTWIRNHRISLKRQAAKRDSTGHILPPISYATVVHKNEFTTDVDAALKDLEKRRKEGNTPHIRHLLKVTLKERRLWIENGTKSINDILIKYPQLRNSDSIIFEFLILKNLTMESVSEKIDAMLKKISKFFDIKENYEKSMISSVTCLYNYLTKKNRQIKPLFITQTRSNSKDMETEDDESPRCVVYTVEQDIRVAYIVAGESIIIKIERPSTGKIITCLLAAYYVWNTVFPKQYRNILEYFDYEILGNSIQRNQVLMKFLRDRDADRPNKELEAKCDAYKRQMEMLDRSTLTDEMPNKSAESDDLQNEANSEIDIAINNELSSMKSELDMFCQNKIDDNLCILCLKTPKNAVFVHENYGHFCLCYKCALQYWTTYGKCPKCPAKIDNIVEIC